MYIENSIYDKFLALLVSKVEELSIGDGFDDKNGGGPVVRIRPLHTTLLWNAKRVLGVQRAVRPSLELHRVWEERGCQGRHRRSQTDWERVLR